MSPTLTYLNINHALVTIKSSFFLKSVIPFENYQLSRENRLHLVKLNQNLTSKESRDWLQSKRIKKNYSNKTGNVISNNFLKSNDKLKETHLTVYVSKINRRLSRDFFSLSKAYPHNRFENDTHIFVLPLVFSLM